MHTQNEPQPPEELVESIRPGVGLLEYLSTEKGSALANRLLETFGSSQAASAAAAQEQQRRQLEYQHRGWISGIIALVVIFALAISTFAFLSWKGKLDPVVATLIGTIVGYALGRRQP